MLLRRLGAFFWDIFQVVIFAVTIFLFVYFLLVQPHKIKGDSMQPNYPDGEYLLTDKVTYRLQKPKRGDVVVFEPPMVKDEEYIKRIVGLPGETVSVHNGSVYINGSKLVEPYLASTLFTSAGAFSKDGVEVTVPENQYFVLGDNRPNSSDSRAWGFVPEKKLNGKAWLIYWPPEKAGFAKDIQY